MNVPVTLQRPGRKSAADGSSSTTRTILGFHSRTVRKKKSPASCVSTNVFITKDEFSSSICLQGQDTFAVSRLAVVLYAICGLLIAFATGCGGNLPQGANAAANQRGNQRVNDGMAGQIGGTNANDLIGSNSSNGEFEDEPAGDMLADQVLVAPGVPQSDAATQESAVEVVNRGDGRRPAKTGLVHGLTQMLNSTPLEDDQKDSLRNQMEMADNILHDAKLENQEAMRQAFRQMRSRGATSPNIVMIVADDLNVADLNCYGHSEILTPNIDRLAQQGVRFTQAYAASTDSIDARWSLVAGRRPDQAGARNQSSAALQSDDLTVAEVLWQGGYTTGVFGHWGVQSVTGPAEPAGHGYDEWLGTYGLPDEPQPYPEFVHQNGNKLRLIKNTEGRQGQFVQDFFVSEASVFLTRHVRRRPVFLQLFFSVPSVRRTVPELENYADKNWPDPVKIRADSITRMDRDIGKLIKRLEELEQFSNTIFVITSDTPSDQPSMVSKGSQSAPVLRGLRGDLYEGGLRVPLILSGTPVIPAGKTSAAATAAWDLPATFFQLANVMKVPQRRQGQSLVHHLKPNTPLPERFLRWEPRPGEAAMAVRWKDWKAIRPSESGSWELYDLKADPAESRDLASEKPEVIGEILAKLSASNGQTTGVTRGGQATEIQ